MEVYELIRRRGYGSRCSQMSIHCIYLRIRRIPDKASTQSRITQQLVLDYPTPTGIAASDDFV
jgi:hypothetical protein